MNDFNTGDVFSGSLTFTPGQTTKTITFRLLGQTAASEGTETIIVTLSNPSNCIISQSTATTTVLQPTPPTSGRPKTPAAAVTTLRVPEDYATVMAAYNAANSGDHISLANGVYSGNYTFSNAFANNIPVVIKSRSPLGAVFTGKIYNNNGNGHWFYELKTTYQGSSETDGALMLGNYSRATRCWFDSGRAIVLPAFADANNDGSAAASKHHIWIGWNRFTGRQNAGESSTIKIYKKDGAVTTTEFSDIYIYRNFFSDTLTALTGSVNTFHIYIGNSQPFDGLYPGMPDRNGVAQFPNFVIEENYVSPADEKDRFAYLKTGITEVSRNHVRGGRAGIITQRTGRGTRFWGNRTTTGSWVLGGGGEASIYGDVRRNVWAGVCRLDSGYLTANDHYAFDHALLYANTGTVQVGYIDSNSKPDGNGLKCRPDHGGTINGVRIYQHSGTVQNLDPAVCDVSSTIQNPGNPLNITNPPVVAGVTDANGTVLSSFGPLNVGLERADQEREDG
jgi:hypothetical protein